MIRKLLVISIIGVFVLSIVSAGNAQQRKKKDNQFGITVGYTSGYQLFSPDPAKLYNDPTGTIYLNTKPHKFMDSRIGGYTIGFNAERQVYGNFYFAPEALIVKTGDKFYHLDKEHASETIDPANPQLRAIRLSEFTNYFFIIPLTYKYYFQQYKAGGAVPYIVAGPELAYLIKSEQKPYVLGNDPTNTNSKDNFNTSTWGFSIGVGLSYKMVNSPLTLFGAIRWTRSYQDYNNYNYAFDPSTKINYSIILVTFGTRY
jgi:hypothetical protein